MNIKNLLTTCVALLFLNGCSYIKTKLQSQIAENNSIKTIIYNFIEPRRFLTNESPAFSNEAYSEPSDGRFIYYSASGYKCKTISLIPMRSACLIDGNWLETAPVLLN